MKTYLQRRRTSMVHVGLLWAVLGAMLTQTAWADFWGASAVTAVPEFQSNGDVSSYTVLGTPNGNGVATTAVPKCDDIVVNCLGISRLFVPVTAPLGSQFATIWLRAADNIRLGYVQASLYRQPVSRGKPTLLGSVQTQTVAGDGFQVVVAPVQSYWIDQNRNPVPVEIVPGYTFYLEIAIAQGFEISRVGDPAPQVMAFDVGLDLDPCTPGHPEFDPDRCSNF